MKPKKPKDRRAKRSDPINPGATEAEETEPKTGVETAEEEKTFGLGRPGRSPGGEPAPRAGSSPVPRRTLDEAF
jgi:hypothetical protein